jgi:hypothetical protein
MVNSETTVTQRQISFKYSCFVMFITVILVNDQLDAQLFLYMFISILYMFRADSCSSSGESIVSIQHLTCVTLCNDRLACRLGNSFPTCILDGHLRSVTHTRCCIDTIDSPDDEHEFA